MDFGPDGNLLVIDGLSVVNKYDPASGQLLKVYGQDYLLNSLNDESDNPGQLNSATGIAVDSSGHLYVADDLTHRIQKFDTNGKFKY